MHFDDYQDMASGTDQFSTLLEDPDSGLLIPLLGLAGESGTLLAEFKKKIRDGEAYEGFNSKAEEELGDILWYLSNLATRLGLSLSTIAAKNLHKTQERWPIAGGHPEMFLLLDEGAPASEQLPRVMDVLVTESVAGSKAQMQMHPEGTNIGDPLTDNNYEDDGYRFHDVMDLANMAVLGWSPVMRSLLKRKRKTQPKVDEVEDGGRAIVLEEAVVAYIYSNAQQRKYYENIKHLDSEMLATIKRIVAHVEVNSRTTKDWERTIIQGYAAFRHLLSRRRALLRVDLRNRDLIILE